MLKDTNEYECQYIITHDGRDKFVVEGLTEFKQNFDTMYKAMFQRKVELASRYLKEEDNQSKSLLNAVVICVNNINSIAQSIPKSLKNIGSFVKISTFSSPFPLCKITI